MISDDAARRIAELEHALEDAERRAATDALTGVLNRRGWDEALAREEDRCRRHELDAAVFVIDLDELKQTNSRGHAAGDDLLRRCAAALQQAVRAHDVVARVGGDEFAVLAVRADKPAAEQLGRRLASELEHAGVNATVGAACIDEGPGLGAAWELADHRMLAGKADGAAH